MDISCLRAGEYISNDFGGTEFEVGADMVKDCGNKDVVDFSFHFSPMIGYPFKGVNSRENTKRMTRIKLANGICKNKNKVGLIHTLNTLLLLNDRQRDGCGVYRNLFIDQIRLHTIPWNEGTVHN